MKNQQFPVNVSIPVERGINSRFSAIDIVFEGNLQKNKRQDKKLEHKGSDMPA